MSLVAGALQAVFTIVLGYVYNVLGMLTGSFLVAAVSIFNWVTDENFISLSYTNAGLKAGDNGFNSFVNVGWTLTRDFTNIIFVIALVVIGLATALRISDYKVQKTLPMFIAVALLINFTPVILGFVIDASNIVTNFFIGSGFAGGNTLANKIFGQWSNLSALNGGVRFWDPIATNESMAASVGSMVLTSFNLFAGLIYLLFALIFAIRYVALWTLVVLSPLAFACYILPATKGVWAMWWKQFIQWCLVGVIASFFLYLADHLIYMTSRGGGLGISESLKDPTGLPGVSSILNATFPYAIPLVLLFVGLFASLSFAPKGADSVIKAGQKGFTKASSAILKVTGKKAWQLTEEKLKLKDKAERAGQWAARKPVLGSILGGPALKYAESGRKEFDA